MAIQFNCPYCTSAIRVADAAAGRIGKCPKCETRLRVPKPEVQDTTMAGRDAAQLPTATPTEVADDPTFSGWAADEAPAAGVESPFAPVAVPVQLPAPAGADATPFSPLDAAHSIDATDTTPSLLQRRRQKSSVWAQLAVPLIFVAILLGIGAAYWWSQRPAMTGDLPGERLPPDTVLKASIPAALADAPKDAYDAAVKGLIETPQVISTDLMLVEFAGGPEGLQVRLQAGSDTELVRVNVRRNPLLTKVSQEQAEMLNADRAREFHDAAREFMEAWRDSTSSGMVFGNTAAYRDKLGVNALLRGVGYHSAAIIGRKAYPCVHEDDEGRLYFVVPRGTTAFVLTERNREGQGSVFPSEYRFNVTVSAATVAPTQAPTVEQEPSAADGQRQGGDSDRMPAPGEDAAPPADEQ